MTVDPRLEKFRGSCTVVGPMPGELQARAFRSLLGIDELRLFDIDPAATRKCTRNLTGLGFNVVECHSVADAVEGADIITTVTADKQYATILSDNHVGPGIDAGPQPKRA